MTPDLLRRAGEALYGAGQWQAHLARQLGVSDRTMRRWVAGTFQVPPGVADQIVWFCKKRGGALADVAAEITRAAA